MQDKTALFLGGGAPNFTLMSGALLRLHERKVRFDIVSMAGAGGVVGLMYLSPNGMSPEDAMKNTVNFGISDEIYRFFPINYKAFAKWGPSADAFNKYWASLPMVQEAAHQLKMSPYEKLRADWILLQGAMICPSDLTPMETGLSEHPHFIDSLIDFEGLKCIREVIELNAFRLSDCEMVDFDKDTITADHLRAALSYPLIYQPYKIGDELYYEGAAFQCINPTRVKAADIKHFVVLQPMSKKQIRAPRNLWDAYSMSVMMPVAALAQYGVDAVAELSGMDDKPDEQKTLIGEALKNIKNEELQKLLGDEKNYKDTFQFLKQAMDHTFTRKFEQDSKSGLVPITGMVSKFGHWHKADFDKLITKDRLPYVFDWSRSNLEYLFDVGYRAGDAVADDMYRNGYVSPVP